MKRRNFLKTALPITVMPMLLGGFSFSAFGKTSLWGDVLNRVTNTDRVLVLVQLNGGNDGLNTVIPLDQYAALTEARKNILIDEKKILRLNGYEGTGLHPSMVDLQSLFNNQQVSIVQGVSYPNPNFSHFRATDIWVTGSDAKQTLSTGWLGRYFNEEFDGYPANYPNATMPDPLAIQIGSVISTAFQGPAGPMGMTITNPSAFYNLIARKSGGGEVANSVVAAELDFIKQVTQQSQVYASVIKTAAAKAKNVSTKYPEKNSLAEQLKIVARLIAGGMKTRVYMVNMGSFDTHANQVNLTGGTENGAHANLLGKLSSAIGGFQDDLQQLGVADRVMGMTFSEFGRRIKSNASGGTDHGAGAPVILFGSKVKGGLIGSNPVIPAKATVNDNVAMQHDFRSLYSTVLKNWFGISDRELEAIMFNKFDMLPFVSTNG